MDGTEPFNTDFLLLLAWILQSTVTDKKLLDSEYSLLKKSACLIPRKA